MEGRGIIPNRSGLALRSSSDVSCPGPESGCPSSLCNHVSLGSSRPASLACQDENAEEEHKPNQAM